MFARVVTFLGLLALAGSVFAQPTNAVRPLTLRECIDLALEQNFDIKIERLGPQIARFNLDIAYAGYIPVFEASATRSSDSREGRFNPFNPGLRSPSTSTDTEDFDAGIRGVLPTGLTYDFGQSLQHTRSENFRSNIVTFTDLYDGQAGVTLRQPLLRDFLIDQTRQNIILAKNSIQISEYALGDQINAVINNVEQAYFDLIFAIENIKVQEASVALAERLAAENRRRVEVGTLAPLDEKQAESELALRRADLVAARQDYLIRQNALKNLIGDNYANWHGVDIVPTEKLIALRELFDVMESWRRGLVSRPDLQQLRLDLERRDVVLRYQRNQILPAIDLVGSYGHNGLDESSPAGVFRDEVRGDNPFYSFGVVFSVPLSSKGPRSLYRATKAEKEQAVLRYKQAEQNVMVEIDNSIKTAQTNMERIEATRKAREYAEAALQAEQKKLEAGRSTSFVVLQLQRDLTEARFREIRALADYNKSLAQLAFSEGTSLDRNGLKISVK